MRRGFVLLATAVLVLGVAASPVAAHGRGRRHDRRRHHHHRRHVPRPTPTPAPGIPVTFTVVNDNATAIPCFPDNPDGKTYTVSGRLILPSGTPPVGVTLYVHGLGYAGWFWDFTSVPGYDYAAAEATGGHASVVIDRLGYGNSDIPPGAATCIGSQATIVHEIVQDLRAGTYKATGMTTAPKFSKVGLVGHSAGGELVEIEAYTFKDIDALGIMEWADQFYSLGAYTAFGEDALQCAAGNVAQVGTTETGYAKFGETNAQFNSLMFADAAPNVVSAVDAMRENDPCGQIETILTGTAVDILNAPTIRVPIAYIHAGDDGIFQAGLPWPTLQEALYTGTSKLTDISLPGEGHAVTLERGVGKLEAAMSTWLTANGL
jgi:pimeloyl-ACP methyl ester carboxylesterase